MKFINKILLIFAFIGLISACDMYDLDQQDNPNALDASTASLDDLYNSIQLTFASQYESGDYTAGAMARMYMTVAFTYNAAVTNNTMGGVWNNAYAGLFPDVDALIKTQGENNFAIHVGSAQVLKAWTMMQLVDLMGDVPYSEAGQGTDIISPKVDPGEDVYAAALILLDTAMVNLSNEAAPSPSNDQYYDGDRVKWTTLAKTLKMRAYLNIGNATAFNAIVAGGDIIDTQDEDFQFNYGSQRVNPNSRHWMYNSSYEQGDGNYMNNYYMYLLAGEQVDTSGATIVDPRTRYYFYRKTGNSTDLDIAEYGCHLSVFPDQADRPGHWTTTFSKLPYCYGTVDGYYGRDHLNGSGTPPDGPVKTAYGLYPGGGAFDWDEFEDTRTLGIFGGKGEGILPIMLSSNVWFMIAEVAENAASGSGKAALIQGLNASLEKVHSFKSLTGSGLEANYEQRDGSLVPTIDYFGMGQGTPEGIARLAAYKASVGLGYDAATADGKKDIIAKQMLIALYGNGLAAYNMWRRTGLPSNMSPSLEADPGEFAYRMRYPQAYTTRNGLYDEATDLITNRVFWNASGPELY